MLKIKEVIAKFALVDKFDDFYPGSVSAQIDILN